MTASPGAAHVGVVVSAGAETPTRDPNYPLGVTMVIAAGVCLSFGGLILRSIEAADGWQVLFYRSVTFAATVFVFLVVRYRGRVVRPFRSIGLNGLVAALCLGAGFASYLFGVLLTTVANVVFIVSASPFFAAVLGRIMLGERVHPITAVAIAVALAGIGLMLADGLAAGRWLGNLVALGAPISFAIMLVVMRRARAVDMMPATCLAGLVATLIAVPMLESLAISAHDLALSVLMGTVQIGAAFILITLGARHVPAAEVALLTLFEAVLAPVWVWIAIDEVPNTLALAGGGIVLAAVAGQAVAGIRLERRRSNPSSLPAVLKKGSAVD